MKEITKKIKYNLFVFLVVFVLLITAEHWYDTNYAKDLFCVFIAYKYDAIAFIFTTAITIFGFILTSITIFLSCMPRRLRKSLSNFPQMGNEIYSYFYIATINMAFLMSCLTLSIFVTNTRYLLYTLNLIISLSICTAINLSKVIWIILSILRIALAENVSNIGGENQ